MAKAACVVLADTETREALGRVVNAMITAKEFLEAGDEATLVFDGAGTKWIGALANEEHRYHGLFEDVRQAIAGACAYCAGAYQVKEEVERAGIPLLEEYERHPSLRSLIEAGYQVITF